MRYEYAHGVSNKPGRPINFVIRNTTNSVFEGLRFVQSQFWTMAIHTAENLLLDNIYINSTSNNSVRPARPPSPTLSDVSNLNDSRRRHKTPTA